MDQLRDYGRYLTRMAGDVENGASHREGLCFGRCVNGASIDNLAGRLAELEEQNALWEEALERDGT